MLSSEETMFFCHLEIHFSTFLFSCPVWFRHETEENFLEPFLEWSVFLSKHQTQKCFQKEKNPNPQQATTHNKQQPTTSACRDNMQSEKYLCADSYPAVLSQQEDIS